MNCNNFIHIFLCAGMESLRLSTGFPSLEINKRLKSSLIKMADYKSAMKKRRSLNSCAAVSIGMGCLNMIHNLFCLRKKTGTLAPANSKTELKRVQFTCSRDCVITTTNLLFVIKCRTFCFCFPVCILYFLTKVICLSDIIRRCPGVSGYTITTVLMLTRCC